MKNVFMGGRPAVSAAPALRWLFTLVLLIGWPFFGRAQWLTQSIDLKPGWSAVYLHVDASYNSIDSLVGGDPNNPIDQIWLWRAPSSSIQFITSPSTPLAGRDWSSWVRAGSGGAGTFSALIPNAAYLVHSTAAATYTWKIKGKPVAPNYTWTTTGLNFIGFPTPSSSPPLFNAFLALSPAFAGAAEIYQYRGGNLGTLNPGQVISLQSTRVNRGQAYWVRAGTLFNNYFGPFQISMGGASSVDFGPAGSQASLILKNMSTSNLTVCASLLPSETPPTGQASIAGKPLILVRGSLVASNLSYAYSDLANGGACWTLKPSGQPGSEITVVMGVNRMAMTNAPGGFYAGIIRFSDNLNLSQVDVPVSAQTSSSAGLWVGKANVSQVGNYLKTYQVDQNNKLMVGTNGNYIVTDINTNLGSVPMAFPLRLILHNNGTNVVLLQRVYYGQGTGSNLVVASQQSALDPQHLDTARRISAADFPWSAGNTPWACAGAFAPGGTLTVSVPLSYDDQASNPFLHTYHPDHDNLDATFKNKLPPGSESYDITRVISLRFNPPQDDFVSLTSVGQNLVGSYAETVTLSGAGNSRVLHVAGTFTLIRISPISTLTSL